MASQLVENLTTKCKSEHIESMVLPNASLALSSLKLEGNAKHLEAKWAPAFFKILHLILNANSRRGFAGRVSRLLCYPIRLLFDRPRGSLEYLLQTFLICAQADRIELERARLLFSEITPAAILVGEDGLGGNLALIAVSRRQKCPVVIIPYEYSSINQVFEALHQRKEQHQIGSAVDLLVSKVFKKWMRTLNGTRFLRIPVAMLLSKEVYCLAPQNPWTVHGGQANFIAAESKKMAAHYISEGIAREKIVNVGHLAGDDLWHALNERENSLLAYKTQSKIHVAKTVVLVALPPSYVSERPGKCEFQTYEQLVDFWIEAITRLPSVEPIFQLHPAVQPEHREYIKLRANVSDKDITSLIPHSDLLITSVSSIIRMAISCRKPVVNYDVYHFDYPDYKGLPGVLHVSSSDTFVDKVTKLCADEKYYRLIAQHQRESSSDWGELDGLACTRLVESVKAITMSTSRHGLNKPTSQVALND